jgi:hypothetical protein
MDTSNCWLCRIQFHSGQCLPRLPRFDLIMHAQALFSLVTLTPSFRYLERLWGAIETAKFIAIVIAASNLIAFFVSWLEYAIFGSELFMYVALACH